jgi:mannose-6-phosphate isomerase-like protein (cupin superfamily)
MEHARLAARDMMIKPIDATKTLFDITHGGNVTSPVPLPGTPQRIDGLSIGWVQMDRPPPHAGEVHYDGDEILIIVSGRVRVIGDSPPAPVEFGAGEARVVPRGEWHRLEVVEPAQLIHITPGPSGDHRPL